MNLIDYLGITTLIGASTTILGLWLKSRLDTSIKHEYDKVLETFKTELKKSDVLLNERLAAFKNLSAHLLALRRYCHACSEEFKNDSEFAPRPESLPDSENISLLCHHENITRVLDSSELFISPNSRHSFDDLFMQMCLGFNLEQYLDGVSKENRTVEMAIGAPELYDLISRKVNDVLNSLHSDLGLPQSVPSKLSTT